MMPPALRLMKETARFGITIGRAAGDNLGNLWPLAASVNRHGLSLAEQPVTLPGPTPKSHKLAEARTKKKKGDLWILVKDTK